MLVIPAFKKIDDVTVYQDDAIWTRFYLVPSKPTISRDSNSRPVFLLSVWGQSDQVREGDPAAARGGGYLNFDVQYAVDAAITERARRDLQEWIDGEFLRRKADPVFAGDPEFAGPTAPEVQLNDPVLSGGTVKMHTTQSELLVSKRLAEGPAALVSGSTAIFNLDLTETGAGFMKDLFISEAGDGRIDLTPVQVAYDLKMLARTPKVLITVTGDSHRIHQTLLKVSETNRDDPCTPAEVETYRQTGTNSSTLKETGAVVVKIDKGDAKVSDEVVEALQQYALDMFDTMVKERFLVPADGDTQPLEFEDELAPGAGDRSGRVPSTRYKVRETLNEATMHLEIKIDRSQVVEWPTGGQATLETFFAGVSDEEMRRHFVELTTDEFNSLGVTVRALVDFEKMPVQAVEVQTEYSSKDRDGQPHTTPGSFTFTAGANAPAKFDPRIINKKIEYRYRYRVIFDDGTAGAYTDWESTTSRSVNVTVPDPGKLSLEVSGASLNWDVLRGVRVDLTYNDPADGQARRERTLELTKLTPVKKWEETFSRPMGGSISARTTYLLADEKVLEGPTETVSRTNTLLVVPPPQADVLNVSLVPSGDWSDVAHVVVSMEYDAGEGRIHDRTFHLSAIDQFVEWQVLLRDPARRTFRYRTVIAYKTGTSEESSWVTKTGDQAVIIHVKGSPKFRVSVASNLVDFQRTPVVTVSLTYGDRRQTLSFTNAATTVWEVLATPGQADYTYEITWHPTTGAPIKSGPQRTTDSALFIPRAVLPTVGKLEVLVRGFAVDFTATPFVDVALVWKDGDREETKTITLSKEQPNASWSVDIGDRTERSYRYTITYNLADGTRVPGASGETTDPVVSVIRHQ